MKRLRLPTGSHKSDALVAREDFDEERKWRIQHGHDLARVTAERDQARAELHSAQFRRGDTVRWPKADYAMYVTVVTAKGVTTDAWSEIDPAELTLVKPVEDKYDALLNSVGGALKERATPPRVSPFGAQR